MKTSLTSKNISAPATAISKFSPSKLAIYAVIAASSIAALNFYDDYKAEQFDIEMTQSADRMIAKFDKYPTPESFCNIVQTDYLFSALKRARGWSDNDADGLKEAYKNTDCRSEKYIYLSDIESYKLGLYVNQQWLDRHNIEIGKTGPREMAKTSPKGPHWEDLPTKFENEAQ